MANKIHFWTRGLFLCFLSICAVLLFDIYFTEKRGNSYFTFGNGLVTSKHDGQKEKYAVRQNDKNRSHASAIDIFHDTNNFTTSKLDLMVSAHAQSHCLSSKKDKLILLYNPKRWEKQMLSLLSNFWSDCPCTCELTRDRKRFEESDAVIFVLDLMPLVKTIPKKRNGQVWIFSYYESVDYLANEAEFEIMQKNVMDMFKRAVNWTMSYRRDSDFVFVHGDYSVRTEFLDDKTLDNILENYKRKSRNVAWFVSHCKTMSKREEYVSLMRNNIAVDEFGGCSDRMLPNCQENNVNILKEAWGLHSLSNNVGLCSDVLDEKYKFYLSFENSLCRDYLTEKSLHHVVRHNVIPIMRSGVNHSLFNPPHSYINANEFTSVRNLTLYLKVLGSQPKEMLKYFEWRKFYSSAYPVKIWQNSICEICKRLHEPKTYSRLYEDIYRWIMKPNNEDACYFPKDLF